MKPLQVIGVNINGIDQSNIILNAIYITYPILVQLPLPNIIPLPLASNLIRIRKHRRFPKRCLQLSLCKSHRWKLLGNCLVLTVVMVIYHYVERIWRILVNPSF